MSESQTQSFNPTPGAVTPRRQKGVLVWLLVLVLAVGAVAVSLWYAGGTNALAQLGSLASSFVGMPGGSSGQAPAVAAVTPTTTPTAAVSLPPEAQQHMFAEQAESREALSALVAGQIDSLETGVARQDDTSATVPITAMFKDGSSLSGFVRLKKFEDSWYFFSLARSTASANPKLVSPAAFDSGVVSTITEQQALPGTQEMLTKGLLDGGYRLVKVNGVTLGPRTATVDVTLSKGTQPEAKGRFVCISKTDGDTPYWFVARFEKR